MTNNIENLLLRKAKEDITYDKVKKIYDTAKNHEARQTWELWYEVGRRIMKSDLKKGVFDDAKVDRRFVNFVNKNLRRKLSEIKGAGIDVDFEVNKIYSEDGNVVSDALQLEVVQAYKDFDLLDTYNNVLIYPYFYGEGWVYQGWNGREMRQGYETGIPEIEIIDPYDIIIDPNTRRSDKEDMRYLFHRRLMRVSELREMFYYDSDLMKFLEKRQDDEEFDLITYHFKEYYPISLVGVVDNNKGTIRFFSEQEYKEYLNNEVQKRYGTIAEQFVNELETLFRDVNDYNVLPEGVRFTKPIKKNVSGWFEMDFIDGYGQIGDVRYIGQNRRYIPLSALYITDSPYAMGLAYDMAEVLDLHSIITTMQVIRLLKHYKLKVWMVEEGIKNYEYFKEHYEELETNLEIDEGWLREHPGGVPFGYIKLPQVDMFEMSLKKDLEYVINEFSNSPKVTRGIPEYNEMSNSAIQSLLHAVKQGDKDMIISYNKMLEKGTIILKDDIARFKNYPHTVTLYDSDMKPIPIWVNRDQDENKYEDVADKIIPVVEVHESSNEIETQRKIEAINLRNMGAISEKDFIRMYGFKNPVRILMNNAKEKGVNEIVKAVSDNPKLMPLLEDMLRNPDKYIQAMQQQQQIQSQQNNIQGEQ